MSTVIGSVKTIVILLLLTVVYLSSGKNILLEQCANNYQNCGKCCQDSRQDCKKYCKTCSSADCKIHLDKPKYMIHFQGNGCHSICKIRTLTGRGLINNGASFFSKRTRNYQVRDEPHFHGMNELNQGQVLTDTMDTEY